MDSTVDALDRRIIRALFADVRASYKSIAESLGVSHNTVRSRMERMLRDGVIRFAVVTNPPKVGLATTAYIAVRVEPAALDHVGQALARRREVSYLGHTIGNQDMFALTHFENNEQLFRFVNHFVARLEGVTGVETSIVCETIKGLPDRYEPIHDLGAEDVSSPVTLRQAREPISTEAAAEG